ncbi:hypothetical protein LEP1GSC190_13435 [Leptospira mayottensis 200901116]|nr:hypothetical protein LEP1GSC190_13435 [Leptospira mayottensis 200901116]TGM95701.1 hypothetical protein EHR03_16495 [Leptospira mayottensis]
MCRRCDEKISVEGFYFHEEYRCQVPIWRQNTLIFRSVRKFFSFLRFKNLSFEKRFFFGFYIVR